MKKNLIAVCVVFGVCFLGFVTMTVLGAVYSSVPLIVVGAVTALVALWIFLGCVYREYVYERFYKLFNARKFLDALHLLDRASANHFFFPLLRTASYEMYIKGELAVDNLAECAKYIELLRTVGGDDWRYKTAFYHIILHLDWGEYALAKEEYEAFRGACASAKIYSEQLEILSALFARIEGAPCDIPNSAHAVPYPAVGRILMREYE